MNKKIFALVVLYWVLIRFLFASYFAIRHWHTDAKCMRFTRISHFFLAGSLIQWSYNHSVQNIHLFFIIGFCWFHCKNRNRKFRCKNKIADEQEYFPVNSIEYDEHHDCTSDPESTFNISCDGMRWEKWKLCTHTLECIRLSKQKKMHPTATASTSHLIISLKCTVACALCKFFVYTSSIIAWKLGSDKMFVLNAFH